MICSIIKLILWIFFVLKQSDFNGHLKVCFFFKPATDNFSTSQLTFGSRVAVYLGVMTATLKKVFFFFLPEGRRGGLTSYGTFIQHHSPTKSCRTTTASAISSEKKYLILPLVTHSVLPFQRLKSFHPFNPQRKKKNG